MNLPPSTAKDHRMRRYCLTGFVALLALAACACSDRGPSSGTGTGTAQTVTPSATPGPSAPTAPANPDRFAKYLDEYPTLKAGSWRGYPAGYALHLHHSKEPALEPLQPTLGPDDLILRLILMDAGAGNTTIIRIQKTGSDIQLLTHRFAAHAIYSGASAGELTTTPARPLTPAQWSTLSTLIDKAKFWSLHPAEESFALDASFLLLEIITAKQHRLVERFYGSPSVFQTLCTAISNLSTSATTTDSTPAS